MNAKSIRSLTHGRGKRSRNAILTSSVHNTRDRHDVYKTDGTESLQNKTLVKEVRIMERTPVMLFLIVSFGLFVVGCVAQTHTQIKDVEEVGQDQSTVIGRLDLVEDGKPQRFSMWKEGILLILKSGSTKAISYNLRGDGSFFLALEPGDYNILGFETFYKGVRGGRIGATFTVSEGAESVYIGKLKVLMEKGMYSVGIEDDYSAAAEAFKSRFPKARQPDISLAILKTKLGAYQRVSYVCADEWGLDCTKKQAQGVGFIRIDGVTPLNPEVSVSAFQEVDTLLPTFDWRPSSRVDLSYDLVIYEAASYTRQGMTKNYLPGNLIVYEEEIQEATFSLKNPLTPDNKYYWSVRLRRNDVVSTWSKFSYFQTLIIYTGSGSNQWFSFATSSK